MRTQRKKSGLISYESASYNTFKEELDSNFTAITDELIYKAEWKDKIARPNEIQKRFLKPIKGTCYESSHS